jgi:sulfoxide reductase heme-binding subunit YedZ
VIGEHAWWLASRASGLVALIAMTASVVLGLTLAGRHAGTRARQFSGLHEQLALTSLVAIVVHAETLLGDPFLKPGLAGITVPFVMDHEPLGTGLGIIAAYVAAALALTFYVRRRFGPRRWRALHRFIVVAWAMSVGHVLVAGTDAGHPAVRIPLFAAVAVVAALLIVRLPGRRSGSRRSSTPSSSASARSPG